MFELTLMHYIYIQTEATNIECSMHNINGKQPNPYLHYSCLFINNTSYRFYRPVNNGQKDPVAEEKTLRVS